MGILTHPAHGKLAQAFQAAACCPLFTQLPQRRGLRSLCSRVGENSLCKVTLPAVALAVTTCWVFAGKSTKALCASIPLLQNDDDLLPTWGIAVHPDEAVQVLEEVF